MLPVWLVHAQAVELLTNIQTWILFDLFPSVWNQPTVSFLGDVS